MGDLRPAADLPLSILTHALTVRQVNLAITTRMNNSFLEALLRLARLRLSFDTEKIETGR